MTDIFFEIHSGLPREAPGDDASTARALGLVRGLPVEPDVLDIGCGPGAQTLVLADRTAGLVTAVDNHAPFLDDLRGRAGRTGRAGRIRAVRASMDELPFRDASFDLVWAEGAIYLMGFDKGLTDWRRLLRPGGWLGVSEIAWLRDDPPRELADFWETGYPSIRSVADNLKAVRACGYEPSGHFVLPEGAWWETYYIPLMERVARLRERYRGDAEALAVLDLETLEIELYRKYAAFYGYVFFIMRHAD